MPTHDVETWLCPLCKTPIGDKPYMATWGVPFVPPHRLYEYCEMPMHFECLEGWADCAEYSLGYFNQFLGTDGRRNGYILARTDNWVLMCGMYERLKQHREDYKDGEYIPTEEQFRLGRIGPAYAQVLIPELAR